jgi:hypothetical protein
VGLKGKVKDRARYKSARGLDPIEAVPGPRSVPFQVLGVYLEGAHGLAALPRRIRNQMETSTGPAPRSKATPELSFGKL